jgi:hypothetical protein
LHTKSRLAEIKKYHLTARLLIWSIVFQCASIFCAIIFWGNFMGTGKPKYGWNTAYHYTQAISVCCIIIMIIMLGKGWTIVRATLSHQGCLKLIGFSTFYVIAVIFAETYAYGYYQYDRMSQYFYNSPSGALVLVLRCGIAPIWFLYAVYTTQKNFKLKKRFYKRFAFIFTVWLLLPALLVLIAGALSPLSLAIYTYIWETLLVYFAQWGLLMMYNPSVNALNANYPFHQNQLGDISDIPWEDVSSTRNLPNRGELGPMSHILSNVGKDGTRHVNIIEIYAAIKKCCDGLVSSADALVPKMDVFKTILRDWDVDDEDRD